jgi:Ca2+:H+ antiporter
VLGGAEEPSDHAGPAWSPKVALGVLGVAAVFLAILSEALVGAIDPFIESFDLTPFFVGVILIPTIGNLAEHLVGVQLAMKNKMDFSMSVSSGSSLRVALFVAPILVLLGLVVNQPMDLVFEPLEVAAVAAAVAVRPGLARRRVNWL